MSNTLAIETQALTKIQGQVYSYHFIQHKYLHLY